MKILLISKHFPPRTTALSLQAGKVALTLAQANADLRVLAGSDTSESLLVDCPFELKLPRIDRVPYVGSVNSSFMLFNRLYRVWTEINETNNCSSWIRRASLVAKETAREFDPDVVVSLSNPFDSHLVGLNLYEEQKRPWLASFSDPYPASYAPPPYDKACRTRFMSAWQIRMLKKVIDSSSGLHFHSKYTAQSLTDSTGRSIESKTFVKPHIGYMGDLQSLNPSDVGNGWLVHIGYLNRERCVPELLLGLKDRLNKQPRLFNGIMCVGGVASEFMEIAEKLGLQKNIKLLGKVSYEKSIEIGSGASGLLLLEAKMPYSAFLPSKIADYSMMKRPILAITPTRSAVRDYLANYKVGISVNHDAQEISSALNRLFDCDDCWFSPENDYENFSREFGSEKNAKDLLCILRKIKTKNENIKSE